MSDDLGDYERHILGEDRRIDPEAWAERQLDGGDRARKSSRENHPEPYDRMRDDKLDFPDDPMAERDDEWRETLPAKGCDA